MRGVYSMACHKRTYGFWRDLAVRLDSSFSKDGGPIESLVAELKTCEERRRALHEQQAALGRRKLSPR